MWTGVLSEGSNKSESFSDGLLEYSQYTKPEVFEGMKVPEVLISGHHKNIDIWRRQSSLENTYNKRPELLKKAKLSEEDKKYLEKFLRSE